VYTPLTVEQYLAGGNFITMFIGPVTVILALRVYHERALLARNIVPVLGGCVAGAIASLGSVFLLCRLFGLDRVVTMSLLPKSVTTAIALDLSERGGGVPGLAVAAVIVTGISSAIFAPVFIKMFRLKDPLAAGVAIGVSGHAIGTAAAVELGKTEGAMSGLAMSLMGIVTGVVYMVLF
jgi:putative effector of murein hydrolase